MDARLIRMARSSDDGLGGGHDSGHWQVDTPWHYHDMHQLLYAFESSVDVEGAQASYRVPHQFAVWIPAGAVHRTRLQQVASGSIFLDPSLVPNAGDQPRVIRAPALLREMVRQALRWPLDQPETAEGRTFFRCVAVLCGDWIEDRTPLTLPTVRSDKLRDVVDFTRAHIGHATLGQVAREHALSERSLRRKFRAETGVSWEEYRRRLRVFLALELLEGPLPIGVIAGLIGYENPAAFARAFRVAVGTTPSAYRRSIAA